MPNDQFLPIKNYTSKTNKKRHKGHINKPLVKSWKNNEKALFRSQWLAECALVEAREQGLAQPLGYSPTGNGMHKPAGKTFALAVRLVRSNLAKNKGNAFCLLPALFAPWNFFALPAAGFVTQVLSVAVRLQNACQRQKQPLTYT